jgi:hypothetical protein
MKRTNAFLCLLALCLLVPAIPAAAQARPANYYHMYCSGFIDDQKPVSGLFVVTSSEGGLKQELVERDIVYLSRGAGYVVNPGAVYTLLRAVQDPNKVESFKGQKLMITTLGTVWAEVGRVKALLVNEQTVTAQVEYACMEIQAGDIAVPFNQRPAPQVEFNAVFDQFAPRSGKNEGIIVASKDFRHTFGAGLPVYLNLGSASGVEAGQKYRVFRTYADEARDPARRLLEGTPTHLNGERRSYRLTKSQKEILPRDVIGEIVILHVTGKSATGLVTKASREIYAGDRVEMQ